MMQQERIAEKIQKSYPFVDIVFGTHAAHKFPELLYRALSTGKRVFDIENSDGVIAEDLPLHRDSTFKAWLPIMYGCNNFCTYCIVPYVRGRERSRSSDIIISEARELVKSGYKEITLLGQNVNSYGNDREGEMNFASLLREINNIDGDFIIRFMTSHPKDCTHELLDTMAQCEKVAKHLHLPVQCGNDRVLKAMNRGYTAEKYLSLLEYARSVMPELSVTSDIIVGFPGETYEEFLDTVKLIEKRSTRRFILLFSHPARAPVPQRWTTPFREKKRASGSQSFVPHRRRLRRRGLLRWSAGNTAFSANQKPRRTVIYRAERRAI